MEIYGIVQNGVVVFDRSVPLPEGAAVVVTLRTEPAGDAANQQRVKFPLIRSSKPGSVALTKARLGEILDEEDVEAANRG